jgi:hypothetical protein
MCPKVEEPAVRGCCDVAHYQRPWLARNLSLARHSLGRHHKWHAAVRVQLLWLAKTLAVSLAKIQNVFEMNSMRMGL